MEDPVCNCGSTYFIDENSDKVIHFEDCILIEKAGLVLW